jgi:hypothetical protein
MQGIMYLGGTEERISGWESDPTRKILCRGVKRLLLWKTDILITRADHAVSPRIEVNKGWPEEFPSRGIDLAQIARVYEDLFDMVPVGTQSHEEFQGRMFVKVTDQLKMKILAVQMSEDPEIGRHSILLKIATSLRPIQRYLFCRSGLAADTARRKVGRGEPARHTLSEKHLKAG